MYKTATIRIRSAILASILGGFLLFSTGNCVWAADQSSQADLIKVVMIYNFAKFTEWPQDAFADDTAPLKVGVIGKDPIDGAWDAIASKQIRGRTIQIDQDITHTEARKYHILYIGPLEKLALRDIIDTIASAPVLTVSDLPEFTSAGGIVQFFKLNNKIRFQINHKTALLHGLKISSHLLKLAKIVDDR